MTVDETIAILKYIQSYTKEEVEEKIEDSLAPIREHLEYIQLCLNLLEDKKATKDFMNE